MRAENQPRCRSWSHKPLNAAVALLLLSVSVVSAQAQPGTPLWVYDTGGAFGPITSSPALAPDGTVYLCWGSNLYAITNSTSVASNKWVCLLPGNTGNSPAIGADGTIYVSGQHLVAVRPDGTKKWDYELGGSYGSASIGFDGKIYAAGSPSLHAVSPAGNQAWVTASIGSQGEYSPVMGPDGSIYISSAASAATFGISAAGDKKWSTSDATPTESAALGSDGTIYVIAGGLYVGGLFALSPDGAILWRSQDPQGNQGFARSPAVGKDGTIYVLTSWNFIVGYGASLYAISPKGALNWNFQTNLSGPYDMGVSTPAIDSAGNIIFTAYNSLFAMTPRGSVLWSFSPGDGTDSRTSPTIGPDGTIYATFGSRLYAIAGTNGLADSPWPMYRQNPRHTGKVEKPSLQKPQKRADANFEFQLFGQISNAFSIEASTNLNTWASLTSFVATTVPMDVFDLTATNFPSRFYRAAEDVPPGAKRFAK